MSKLKLIITDIFNENSDIVVNATHLVLDGATWVSNGEMEISRINTDFDIDTLENYILPPNTAIGNHSAEFETNYDPLNSSSIVIIVSENDGWRINITEYSAQTYIRINEYNQNGLLVQKYNRIIYEGENGPEHLTINLTLTGGKINGEYFVTEDNTDGNTIINNPTTTTSSNSTTPTTNSSSTTNTENPFDIDGYPLAYLGSTLIITSIIIARSKRYQKRIVPSSE